MQSASKSSRIKTLQSKVQETNQHVQTNFQKLVQMQEINTAKQYAYLLDSLKDDTAVQKLIISKYTDTVLPKNTLKDKNRKQTYQNYRKLMNYSLQQKQKNKFRTQSSLSSKQVMNPQYLLYSNSLHSFVQRKKKQMILEENFLINEQNKLQNAMKDSKTRAKIFQEALLFQRLYNLEKTNSKRQKFTFPKNFIKINPKHMRIPQKITSQTQFYRRKYIHNQKTFNFHRQIIRLHNQVLQKKIQNNMLVIKKVLDFNQINAQRNDQNKYQISTQNLISLKRLFLKYSSGETDQIQDIFKHITKEKIGQFFVDFQIKIDRNHKINQIISDRISQFDFMQIFYYLSNTQDVGLFTNINEYLSKIIFNKEEKILIEQEKFINLNQKYLTKMKKLKRFSQKVNQIFQSYVVSSRKQKDSNPIDFNQIMELMWEVKLYPYKLSKKKIRFYYEYIKTQSNGLNVSHLQTFFLFVMTTFEGQIQQKFKKFINDVINQSLKAKNLIRKQ